MKHSFIHSHDLKCAKQDCKRTEIEHSDQAECDCCDNIGPCEMYHTLLLCVECYTKETSHQSLENQEKRLQEHRLIQSQILDNSIQLKTDIFNAETVSIVELKSVIDNDNSIENKNFKLAEVIKERFTHFSKLIFDKNEEVQSLVTKQRATQTYLNDLSNKLRIEEREKLKLLDINYHPNPTKISKPRVTNRKSFDKVELKKYASEVGIPESVLQMICVAKNLTPEQAAKSMKSAMISNN